MENIPWQMIIDKLEKVSLQVTEGTKAGIKFVWPLAVKEVMIKGFIWILVGIILSFVTYKVMKWAKKTDLTSEDRFGKEDMTWLVYFLCLIMGVVNVCLISYALPRLLNPQWYAIQRLIELLD